MDRQQSLADWFKTFAGNYSCAVSARQVLRAAHGTDWNRAQGCAFVAQVVKVKAGCIANSK
jgi:hypothetical protein